MFKPAAPFALAGLRIAPAQVWGAFRLVPLVRVAPCEDVRLAREALAGPVRVSTARRREFWTFVPHALHLRWGTLVGAQVRRGEAANREVWRSVADVRKLRERDADGLRFLPLALALEGLLAVGFAPPTMRWPELSDCFVRHGLVRRSESAWLGAALPGFADALRTFELHRGQVGMAVFVADEFASLFVVPHPDDYRALHHTLLTDLYGELLLMYAAEGRELSRVEATGYFGASRDLPELREALALMRRDWAEFTQHTMFGDWLARDLRAEVVYQPGPLRLERFITDLDPARVNHVGERLVRDDGELLYAKTYRLSALQTRRAHLLATLSDHAWHLGQAAKALHTDVPGLVARIEAQGFGYLLTTQVREQAAKARRLGARPGAQ